MFGSTIDQSVGLVGGKMISEGRWLHWEYVEADGGKAFGEKGAPDADRVADVHAVPMTMVT